MFPNVTLVEARFSGLGLCYELFHLIRPTHKEVS